MKNIFKGKIILTGLILFSVLSCSKEDLILEDPNNPAVNELLDFSSILVGVYDAYQKIPTNEYILTEMRSDNTSSKSGEGNFGVIDNYRYDGSLPDGVDYWANSYRVIRQANFAISNAENLDDNSIGQAYFMRALAHFNLVRLYRNIPYVDQFINTIGELSASFSQLSEEETYNKIIEDFIFSIESFKKSGAPLDISSDYVASQGAAEVMLAKAYMSRPNKTNVDYNNAKILLEPMIGLGNAYGYDLIASGSYLDIFTNESGNAERIFTVSYTADTSPANSDFDDSDDGDSQSWANEMTRDGGAQGLNVASDQLIATFTARIEPVRTQFNLFEQERRFYNNKYRSNAARTSDLDWIVLRYADVLLLYVEAVLAGEDNTTDQLAIDAYNRVRDRAGMPLSSPAVGVSKQALLDERRVEFAYENQRLFDLIRFDEVQTVLKAYSDANNYDFDANEDILAIPNRELELAKGLFKQNPGY